MSIKLQSSYKTIGEVVKILNNAEPNDFKINAHTLRFWETRFLQIKPRIVNNRRYYDQKNVDTLLKIQYLLKKQGMTIAGVKKILNNSNLKIDENNKKIISSSDIKNRLNKINKLIKNLKKD